jgi:hypothetical protein
VLAAGSLSDAARVAAVKAACFRNSRRFMIKPREGNGGERAGCNYSGTIPAIARP